MKVSVSWLQKYFNDPLPPLTEVVDALTFHSSEVEEVMGEGENAVLDVKVLPDRAAYALSHRGMAYELAAALDVPLASDPLRTALPDYASVGVDSDSDSANRIQVSIEDAEKCPRYMSALITGVTVGPSPQWLKDALTSLGQRSINNVVDATNYVMLNIGQPLHAFDAAHLSKTEVGGFSISVRGSKNAEKITTLTGEEYALPEGTIVITDAVNNTLLGIAGVKGGKAAEITESTTDIIIESANFNGTSIRKASQALKLWTDASLRFQNKISSELAAYGMRDVLALILEIAGGTISKVTDCYPAPETPASPVTFTLEQVNGLLGTSFSVEEVVSALSRLSLEHVAEGETVTVRPSFERRDLVLWQDLAEEIGRILGYDKVEPADLPAITEAPDQNKWSGIERIKDLLIERGFTEISTQSFAAEGEIRLANPLQSDKPMLRASLAGNVEDSLARATQVAPRVLGPDPMLKLFELGTVFTNDGEHLSLCLGYCQLSGKQSGAVIAEAADALVSAFPASGLVLPETMPVDILELSLQDVNFDSMGGGYTPVEITLRKFQPFSNYPSALRDIAIWTPERTGETELTLLIQKEAGDLLARMDLFDTFNKPGEDGIRTSFAFRLVFQSDERTLSDADLDPIMARVTTALNAHDGWEVR